MKVFLDLKLGRGLGFATVCRKGFSDLGALGATSWGIWEIEG